MYLFNSAKLSTGNELLVVLTKIFLTVKNNSIISIKTIFILKLHFEKNIKKICSLLPYDKLVYSMVGSQQAD